LFGWNGGEEGKGEKERERGVRKKERRRWGGMKGGRE
jgi:hypothetical protein